MVIGCFRYLWYSGVFTFDTNGLQLITTFELLYDYNLKLAKYTIHKVLCFYVRG